MWIAGTSAGAEVGYGLNGHLVSKETFKDGVREGLSTYYHPNGSLKSKFLFAASKDHKSEMGEFIQYWEEDGTHTVVNGNGTYTLYYQTGEKWITSTIKNGRTHGKKLVYTKEGV